ncbi:MAG: ParB/RepB/Spo0J family partition protein [Bacteroidia bacterium]|jgi:ParB family transcriptional regulator, chromosome partitioning protein
MAMKKSAMGRGLSALLESNETDITQRYTGDLPSSTTAGSVANLRIDQIVANRFQPRNKFEQEALEELAQSIKELGIIQAITVRKMGYDKYELISGERRFRASQLAGLTEIPAFIRIANDQQSLEMALVENIQRENLDAIEIALSYQRLIDECNLTQEEMSERVGKKRSTITNYLRLLKLQPEIQRGIIHREISMAHARTLVSVDDEATQLQIYHDIIKNDLSVRQVEEWVRGVDKKPSAKSKKKPTIKVLPYNFQKLSNDLTSHFKTTVDFKRGATGKGQIVIPFSSDVDLERIISLLKLPTE